MAGLYVGATAGYSGKNMVVMGLGLRLQKEGFSVGYLKPVGAVPKEIDGNRGVAVHCEIGVNGDH